MVAKPMLSRSWWILALRGVLALLFGVLALLLPGPTVLSLVLLFAAYALLAGIVYLVGAVRNRRHATGSHALDWWLLLMLGVVSVVAGVLAVMQPGLAALVLVLIVGVNALITGILDIVLAVRLRGHARPGVWLLLAGGIASIIFGTILIALPTVGALALVWLIGAYAIVAGILYMVLAFRSYEKEPKRVAGDVTESLGVAATEGATIRTDAARKETASERRVGERRMTPAGQH
nr:HdeD family acid-resistance protein [uncultured Duganella sp.]